MRYQPIENHGIVGNMHSAALVSLDGSVDWLCLPRFDSPSVFGAILDADKGGGSGSPRPRPAICATSNTTGRKPTSWSPASCTPTASPRSRTTCRSSPGPGRMPSSSAGCGWSGVNCRWRSSAARRSTTPGRGTPLR